MTNSYQNHQDIRIGTLAQGGAGTANYLKQILPHGFESISLTFWQTLGTTDLPKLASEIKDVLQQHHAVISSLAIFGNPLESGENDLLTFQGWEKLVDHAHLFGTDIVAGFAGRLRNQPIDASIPRFKEVFGPLAKRAADKGVRLAFENCSMGGTWRTGDWNIAHNPEAWELMFDAIPDSNVGLEWEPCHQLVTLIDPIPQIRQWSKRMFHIHGKDATVMHDVVRTKGVTSKTPFAFHRTPGFGDSDWIQIISELRRHGFKGSIDIEGWHDPVYKKELEMTGQVHGLNYLKACRGGPFIPNPVA